MPLNVLVVEDSENDALLAVARLEGAGWDVEWLRVSRREELEAALDERRWDVLLVDYVLPGFGGREALALVSKSGLDAPFIIVSGKVGEETAVEAMHAGAHDFVSKDNLTRLPAVVARELREAESRRQHRQAEEAMQLQAAALRAAANAVLITDAEGHIEWTNRAFTKLTGFGEAEVLGETRELTMAPDTLAVEAEKELTAALADGRPCSGERVLRRKDGALVTVLETATPLIENGAVSRVIVIQEDITRRLADEGTIDYPPHHDRLTDVPDRLLLLERLERACAHTRREDRSIAVVALDVDHFEKINVARGRPFGDAVLRAVATRLSGRLRAADTVSRVGGDEFTALLLNIDSPENAELVTRRILAALSEPFTVDGTQVHLGATAGVAFFLTNGASADEMLRAADIALLKAKQAGGGRYTLFSPEMAGAPASRRK
jgi:diguanylate cyclase (GGDEF)-like protein/PAS domain S-box-containing protein